MEAYGSEASPRIRKGQRRSRCLDRRVRAFRTELWGVVSIVPAVSASEAKSITVRCAESAGYGYGRQWQGAKSPWALVRCKREPKHDKWAATAKRQCWAEDAICSNTKVTNAGHGPRTKGE